MQICTFLECNSPAVSRGCPMSSGTVYLSTDVSHMMGKYHKDTIPVVNGKGVINLVGAQPNPLKKADSNYAKYFSANYTDILKRGVSTDTIKPALPVIVVTGVAIDTSAKTFLTVTPQVPLLYYMILRAIKAFQPIQRVLAVSRQ